MKLSGQSYTCCCYNYNYTMRSNSQTAPGWLANKRYDSDLSTQLDQTMTRPFYASTTAHRSIERQQPVHNLPVTAFSARKPLETPHRQSMPFADHLTLTPKTGRARLPVEQSCQHLIANIQTNQNQQALEVLNREHERLRRTLAQRRVHKDGGNSLLDQEH